ncbi:MAG TPA: Rrf2 family transcriptional regulator [bacterium]|jgi:Rrf2 family protein
MLSKKAKYGLKALVALAREYPNGRLLIADLAGQERIPRKFLELILLDLKNHGLLHSRRGRGGGYALGKAPSEIAIGLVIRELDGPLAPMSCVSHTAYHRCEECVDERTCGIRAVMAEVREATARVLDHTSLAQMVEHEVRLERTTRSVGRAAKRRDP